MSEPTSWEVTVEFSASDPIFRDHFPGTPVVPGSLVVQAAIAHCAVPGQPVQIKRFRFYRFLPPGAYLFSFSRTEQSLTCEVSKDLVRFARGTLVFS